jgi:hypothetical protein
MTTQRRCNQALYEEGTLIARCSEVWGTEHLHDLSAKEAIQQGRAIAVPRSAHRNDEQEDT